jgi:hypothetical protein
MTAVALTADALPQHLAALAYGERIRQQRAATRREVFAIADTSTSQRALAALVDVDELPAYLRTLNVLRFVSWAHQIGPFRARQYLRVAGIGETRELGQLTRRQRALLAHVLRCDPDQLAELRREQLAREWARSVTR